MTLEEWLTSHGLEKYIDAFYQNDIGIDVLAHLTEQDLVNMGLSVGARRRILVALGRVDEQAEAPPVVETAEPAVEHSSVVERAVEPVVLQQVAQPVVQPATQPQPSAAAVDRHAPKGRAGRKMTAIMIAIGVHVCLALIAGFMVIFPPSKDEPELIAMVAPQPATPKQEIKKKTVQKQVKRAPSAASAAAAPMAMMMKARSKARFTMPDVTRTSTGPLGVGEGDLGKGAFGVGTGLEGAAGAGGGTMFGSAGTGGSGRLFDIKQSPKGRDTGLLDGGDHAYWPLFKELVEDSFAGRSGKKYFQAPKKFSFTFLGIPKVKATECPKLFDVEDVVKPQKWAIHYKFRVTPPDPREKYRFFGYFDDGVAVRLNGETILWHSDIYKDFPVQTPSQYVEISSGATIEVIITEWPGGHMGGMLAIEKQSEPGVIYPFTLVKMSKDDITRYQTAWQNWPQFPGKLNLNPKEIPVFRTYK